ncbi:MAG: MBL fold metallo-hydrolase [Pseudomonadota bacterium]
MQRSMKAPVPVPGKIATDTGPLVTGFFDLPTNTISYVAADPATGKCAIIDCLLDYDHASGCTNTQSADALIGFVKADDLSVEWIIDTHVHADHLTAAPYVRHHLGGKIAIGNHITNVQKTFSDVFNEDDQFHTNGSQFDHLFTDDETYSVGDLTARAIHTPGHTPACMCHLIGDALFTGDTLFMPDFGTARCDFPGGDANALFQSIHRLFSLPDETRVFVGHDYKAPGRDEFAWETTIRTQKETNVHVGAGTTRETFVKMREARDATLAMPKLIYPSVQVNMRAGTFPAPENNGKRYLKIPLNTF